MRLMFVIIGVKIMCVQGKALHFLNATAKKGVGQLVKKNTNSC